MSAESGYGLYVNDVIDSALLDPRSSIFTAELVAILRGLTLI